MGKEKLKGQQIEHEAFELGEASIERDQPKRCGPGERGQISIADQLTGGLSVSEEFRQDGVDQGRLRHESETLVFEQLTDGGPRDGSRNRVLPKNRPTAHQSDDREL